MTTPTYVHEPVLVQARFLPNGHVQPTAFIWRERTRYIADTGREWDEADEGASWRCYLVRTPNMETFELRFDPGGSRWLLQRAWLNDTVA
jgi:hypothetical protein